MRESIIVSNREDVCSDHQDVEDVLHNRECIGRFGIQGQDGDEEDGHADDDEMEEHLEDLQ